MKFVVSIPYYSELCGGVSVLFELARRIHEAGHDSKVFVYDHPGPLWNPIYTNYATEQSVDSDTIVVYSEMDLGNRLCAKRIVRLVLYGSHMYDNYDANEIIYYHAPFCKLNKTTQFLTVLRWPPGFTNQNLPRTNKSCYVVKKGERIPQIRLAVANSTIPLGINLDGLSHSDLISIFNTTKYFYCYDPCCFLIIMALMCGCIVIQHPIPGYTAEEWRYTIGFHGTNGIAYGIEDLPRAESTISNAPLDCERFKQTADTTIAKFLHDMETGSYSRDPCYKFNDSPYALQHVMK